MNKRLEKYKDQIEEYFKSLVKIKVDNKTDQFELYLVTSEVDLNRKLSFICAWFITKLLTLKNEKEEKCFIERIGSLIEKSLNEYYKYPEYRLGQAFFNYFTLSEEFKNYTQKIVATGADCFYDDDNITRFLNKIWNIINENKM